MKINSTILGIITLTSCLTTIHGFSLFKTPEESVEKTIARTSRKKVDFSNKLIKYWTEHIVWDDRFISAAVYKTDQEDAIADRLMLNVTHIAEAFKPYLPADVIGRLTTLLKEHVDLAGRVTKAAVHKAPGFAELNRKWHENAEHIALLLAQNNKSLSQSAFLKLFNKHLDGANKVTQYRMDNNTSADIKQTDANLHTAWDIANTLAYSFIEQFPRKFK
jgi:hypothetical protein